MGNLAKSTERNEIATLKTGLSAHGQVQNNAEPFGDHKIPLQIIETPSHPLRPRSILADVRTGRNHRQPGISRLAAVIIVHIVAAASAGETAELRRGGVPLAVNGIARRASDLALLE
jgi:hypothetical protein